MDEIPQGENSHVTIRVHKITAVIIVVVFLGLLTLLGYYVGKSTSANQPKIFVDNPQDITPTASVVEYPQVTRVPTPTTGTKVYPPIPDSVPSSVQQKYNEILPTYQASAGYGDGLGAGIQYCKNAHEELYVVWGSGGYTGEQIFFKPDGTFIGRSTFSDTPPFRADDISINLDDYGCVDVRTAEAAGQDQTYNGPIN